MYSFQNIVTIYRYIVSQKFMRARALSCANGLAGGGVGVEAGKRKVPAG